MTTERSGMSLDSAWDAIQILRKGTPFPPGVSVEMLADAFYKAAFSHCTCAACKITHASDCAVHNEPAMPKGPCDCGACRDDDGAYLSAIREVSKLKDEKSQLVGALKDVLLYVVTDTLEHCDGNKCRESWCIGCSGEEYANESLSKARAASKKANALVAMLAQRDGG